MQPIFEAKPQRYDIFLILQGFRQKNQSLLACRADSCSAILSFTLWRVRHARGTGTWQEFGDSQYLIPCLNTKGLGASRP